MKKKMVTKEVEELGNELTLLILPEKKYSVKFLETEKSLYFKMEVKRINFNSDKVEDIFLCFIHFSIGC